MFDTLTLKANFGPTDDFAVTDVGIIVVLNMLKTMAGVLCGQLRGECCVPKLTNFLCVSM